MDVGIVGVAPAQSQPTWSKQGAQRENADPHRRKQFRRSIAQDRTLAGLCGFAARCRFRPRLTDAYRHNRPPRVRFMYTIAKRFTFSASHVIGGLPPGHPCARLHGHNYEVEVILRSSALDAVGFVRDYRELSALKDVIDTTFDHKHLNDVLNHDRTTAEVIGKWFYDWCKERWPEVVAVRVSETPTT